MRGVFNLRPPKAKTGFVWDVKILFDYFEKLPINSELDDSNLAQKTLCLLLLLSGSRLNTIHKFNISGMIITNVAITVAPTDVLKHSRQNRKRDTFTYRQFENKKLCVVDALRTYLARRNPKVSHTVTNLFITNKRPFRPASIDTLRRWVKQT